MKEISDFLLRPATLITVLLLAVATLIALPHVQNAFDRELYTIIAQELDYCMRTEYAVPSGIAQQGDEAVQQWVQENDTEPVDQAIVSC